jgi:hypothetical protein
MNFKVAEAGRRMVVIIDPHIRAVREYSVFEKG